MSNVLSKSYKGVTRARRDTSHVLRKETVLDKKTAPEKKPQKKGKPEGKVPKKVTLADMTPKQLQAVWEEHGRNGAILGKVFGVSRQTVSRHLKRAGVGSEVAITAGQAAGAMVRLGNANAGFQEGYGGSLKSLGLLHRLDAALDFVEEMRVSIKKEIDKQDGRFKPYQIDQMLKLVREIRGLTESSFTIKSKLYEKAAMDSFIEAVVQVVEEATPDAQKQIYIKLSNLGLEDQVIGGSKTEIYGN
jgi:hypothetical protein